jgi:Flp pilus assembly protein TadD
VAPTRLSLAGRPVPAALPGVSLVRTLAGDAPAARPLFAETHHPRLRYGWQSLRSVVRDRWHFVRPDEAPRSELYDLVGDPAERRNVLRDQRAVVRELDAAAAALGGEVGPPAEVDAETRAALSSLGYASSTVTARGTGRHPRDVIHLVARVKAAIGLLRRGAVGEAIGLLEGVVRESDTVVDAWQFLGAAYLEAGRLEDARQAFGRAFELAGGPDYLARPLAEVALRQGRRDEAIAFFRVIVEKTPGDGAARARLASLLEAQGRPEEARRVRAAGGAE